LASGSGGNATYVSDGVTSLLLDCGVPYPKLQRGTGFGLSKLTGVLITHYHQDHSKAAKDLAKRGVDLYSSEGTFNALKMRGHRCNMAKVREILPDRTLYEAFSVGTFGVMPFDVIHDVPEPLGFLAESGETRERLLYFSDTAYVRYTFDNLTHIIAECNHGEYELRRSVSEGVITPELARRITRNHISVERLERLLKANDLSRLQEVHLIHLSDNNSDEERFKTVIQRVVGVPVYVH